jgi:hypothetical protein
VIGGRRGQQYGAAAGETKRHEVLKALPSAQVGVGGSWASANRPATPPTMPAATGRRFTAT